MRDKEAMPKLEIKGGQKCWARCRVDEGFFPKEKYMCEALSPLKPGRSLAIRGS